MSTIFEGDARPRLTELRRTDPDENLIQRFDLVMEKRPDIAERRLGYVPMILEHGWAVVAIPEEGFAYTVGLKYRFDQPELLIAAPELDPEDLKQLLNMIGRYVSLGNRIAANEPVDLTDFGVSLVFQPYSHAVFERYATGYLATFERFFEDTEHETGDTLPVLWTELEAKKPEKKPEKKALKKKAATKNAATKKAAPKKKSKRPVEKKKGRKKGARRSRGSHPKGRRSRRMP